MEYLRNILTSLISHFPILLNRITNLVLDLDPTVLAVMFTFCTGVTVIGIYLLMKGALVGRDEKEHSSQDYYSEDRLSNLEAIVRDMSNKITGFTSASRQETGFLKQELREIRRTLESFEYLERFETLIEELKHRISSYATLTRDEQGMLKAELGDIKKAMREADVNSQSAPQRRSKPSRSRSEEDISERLLQRPINRLAGERAPSQTDIA